jgi:putative transposase
VLDGRIDQPGIRPLPPSNCCRRGIQFVTSHHCRSSELIKGLGPVSVRQQRVGDKRIVSEREAFVSPFRPKYLRKTESMEEQVPWRYLTGISTNDFPEALQALLGKDVGGLSATTVTRLKSIWAAEYDEWSKRSLKDKRYVYVWADGIYSNIRLNDNENRRSAENHQYLLVLMATTADPSLFNKT